MSGLSIPNALANGIACDGNNLDANFDAIQAWADTDVVEVGGATFTGPVLLSGDPTIAAHAARKAYVDAKTWATANIVDGAVTTVKIADVNVTTAKIADSNVTTAKIADSNVTTAKVADSAITAAKIADGVITNAEIAAGTFPAIKSIQTTDLCGRAKRLTSASIAHQTATQLVGNSEDYDYSNMHDTANGNVTIPTAGVYHMDANVTWTTGTHAGFRQVELRRYNSGGAQVGVFASSIMSAGDAVTDSSANSCGGDVLCDAGDTLRVIVYQTSGGGVNVVVSAGVECGYSWHCIRLS